MRKKQKNNDSIEERANEYAERICSVIETNEIKDVSQDFANGARSEHEKLTRWTDPNKKLPDENKNVLVKYIAVTKPNSYYYTVGLRYGKDQWYCESECLNYQNFKIIGWREIHE